jgi:Pterin 4 alpha carbinolamine dehydratase
LPYVCWLPFHTNYELAFDENVLSGHHPDLHLVGWNNVKIEIWTHSLGKLSDFIHFLLLLFLLISFRNIVVCAAIKK